LKVAPFLSFKGAFYDEKNRDFCLIISNESWLTDGYSGEVDIEVWKKVNDEPKQQAKAVIFISPNDELVDTVRFNLSELYQRGYSSIFRSKKKMDFLDDLHDMMSASDHYFGLRLFVTKNNKLAAYTRDHGGKRYDAELMYTFFLSDPKRTDENLYMTADSFYVDTKDELTMLNVKRYGLYR
jgi:hypothetical protein